MLCNNCGRRVPDSTVFCFFCGSKVGGAKPSQGETVVENTPPKEERRTFSFYDSEETPPAPKPTPSQPAPSAFAAPPSTPPATPAYTPPAPPAATPPAQPSLASQQPSAPIRQDIPSRAAARQEMQRQEMQGDPFAHRQPEAPIPSRSEARQAERQGTVPPAQTVKPTPGPSSTVSPESSSTFAPREDVPAPGYRHAPQPSMYTTPEVSRTEEKNILEPPAPKKDLLNDPLYQQLNQHLSSQGEVSPVVPPSTPSPSPSVSSAQEVTSPVPPSLKQEVHTPKPEAETLERKPQAKRTAEKPKSKYKWLKVLGLVAGLLVIGLIAFFAIRSAGNNPLLGEPQPSPGAAQDGPITSFVPPVPGTGEKLFVGKVSLSPAGEVDCAFIMSKDGTYLHSFTLFATGIPNPKNAQGAPSYLQTYDASYPLFGNVVDIDLGKTKLLNLQLFEDSAKGDLDYVHTYTDSTTQASEDVKIERSSISFTLSNVKKLPKNVAGLAFNGKTYEVALGNTAKTPEGKVTVELKSKDFNSLPVVDGSIVVPVQMKINVSGSTVYSSELASIENGILFTFDVADIPAEVILYPYGDEKTTVTFDTKTKETK